MKKILMSIGTIAAVAAPVAAVIACGSNKGHKENGMGKVNPTTTNINKGTQNNNPTSTPVVDEGFKDASLIPNFDISKENAKSVYTYNGNEFNDLGSALKSWTTAAQVVTTKHLTSANLEGTINLSNKNGIITLDIVDKGGKSILNHGQVIYHSIEQLMNDFPQQLQGKVISDWVAANKIVHSYSVGGHSIDSIIYSQAQSLKNKIDTDHDKVYVNHYGGSYRRADQNLDLIPYAKWAPFNSLVAEFRPGDSLVFAFDNESDMASFTQRVRYDNTSDSDNNMPIAKVEEKSIKYQPISVLNGQLMAASVKDYSVGANTSIFKLNVIARNAVEMTFNDIFKTSGGHIDAQLLYLAGFQDANNDGKIDHDDINMIGSFMIDKDKIYSNYNTNTYIHEKTVVAGYDEIKKTLGK